MTPKVFLLLELECQEHLLREQLQDGISYRAKSTVINKKLKGALRAWTHTSFS